MNLLNEIPCWYATVAIVWGIYQGIRGAVEHHYLHHKPDNHLYNWLILYSHDFAFRFVCTLAGFCALYVSYFMLKSAPDLTSLSTGTSALIASSFIVGVIGVGGHLHFIILFGKVPKL